MKRFVGIVVLIALQLGVAMGWLAYGVGKQTSGEVENWQQILELPPEERQMQENLALWYNLNLTGSGEEKPVEGYEQILFFEDGLMCCVEFPQEQKILPVWHGVREKQDCGLTHLSRSALPVGGDGNHTVLTGEQELLEEMKFPERGDKFYLHVLGDTVVYRIFDVKTTKRDPSLTQFETHRDLCSIWIREDDSWVIIRAAREEQGKIRENIG